MTPQNSVPAILDPSWLISILVGFFLPWAIGKLQSSQASEQYRSVFAFLACLFIGTLVAFLGREFVGQWGSNWYDNAYLVVFNVGTLLVTAWQSYARLWVHVAAFKRVNNDPNGFGNPNA